MYILGNQKNVVVVEGNPFSFCYESLEMLASFNAVAIIFAWHKVSVVA